MPEMGLLIGLRKLIQTDFVPILTFGSFSSDPYIYDPISSSLEQDLLGRQEW